MSVTDERLREILAGRYRRAGFAGHADIFGSGGPLNDFDKATIDAIRDAIAEDRAGEKDKGGHPDCWLCQRGGIAEGGVHRFESEDGVKELACPIEYHPSPKEAGTEWRDVPATMGDLHDFAESTRRWDSGDRSWIKTRAEGRLDGTR